MSIPALFEKFGSLGAIVSTMGCASCFPVLGTLGAWVSCTVRGCFINALLSVFAGTAFVSALIS